MKKFSLWKLVAACALAGGGVIAACSSHTTETGAQFPLDRYEAAQPHSEQLLRTAQADPYARDAGVGSGSAMRGDAGVGRGGTGDAGARRGAGDAGRAAPRTLNPNNPPGTPPAPGAQPPTGTPPDTTNPTPTPPPGSPTPTPPTSTPPSTPTPPAGAPGGH